MVKAHEVLTASKDATSIFGGRENAKKNDPIKLAIDNAKNHNLTKDDIETHKKNALDAVNSAFDFADTQPWPKGEDALQEVYVNYPKEVN